jgi:hypothetical protein
MLDSLEAFSLGYVVGAQIIRIPELKLFLFHPFSQFHREIDPEFLEPKVLGRLD